MPQDVLQTAIEQNRSNGQPLPPELSRKLAALQIRLQQLTLLRGVGVLLLTATVAIALEFIIDFKWELDVLPRIGLLVGTALAVGAAVLFAVIRPWLRSVSTVDLATVVEQAHPELRERLSSTVELHDPDLPEAHRGSAVMRGLLAEETLHVSTRLNFADAVSARRPARMAIVGAVALLLLFAPFLWLPSAYALLWSRFFAPWSNSGGAGFMAFEVQGGDRVVPRGSDVTIVARPLPIDPSATLPETIWLNRFDHSGLKDPRRMEMGDQPAEYVTTIQHVTKPFDFNVSSDRSRSRNFRIGVADAPEITTFTLDIEPPAYCGLPASHQDGVVGRIVVFEQSRLDFEIGFSKPVARAELIWLDQPAASHTTGETPVPIEEVKPEEGVAGLPFVLAEGGESARLSKTATRGGQFAVRLTDRVGLENSRQAYRELVLVRDGPPQLVVAGGRLPMQARPEDTLRVQATALDDIGIGALELHYEILGGKQGMQPMEAVKLGARSVAHQFALDLSQLELSDESILALRVRAADERPVPGPNEVWSAPQVVSIDQNAQPTGGAAEAARQQALGEQLEQILKTLNEQQESLSELQQQAESNLEQQTPFEKNEDLESLSGAQQDLEQKVEELSQQFEQSSSFESLADETEQVAEQDLAEARSHTEQAATAPLNEKPAALEDSSERMAEAENKLRDIQDRFNDLSAFERALEELAQLAERLEQLEEQLRQQQEQQEQQQAEGQEQAEGAESNQQSSSGDQQQGEGEQQLSAQQEEIARRIEELLKQFPELVDALKKLHENRPENEDPQKAESGSPRTRDEGGVDHVDMTKLESLVKELSDRDWGRLPGHLRTEMLEAAKKRSTGEYAKLIKLYFRQIAETAAAPPPKKIEQHDDGTR